MEDAPLPAPSPSGARPPAAWRVRLHRWYHARRYYLWLGGFACVVLILALSRSIFYVIPAGHAGVVFRHFLGGTQTDEVRDEGLQLLFPWDTLTVYDVRLHQVSHSFSVISRDGLEVGVTLSVRYRPKIELLGVLHQEVGPEYVEKIVLPEIQALVRMTFGEFTPEEMYTTKRTLIEQTLLSAVTQIGDRYLVLDDLLVKEIKLPPALQKSIESKLVEQQSSLAMEFRIARERLEAERKVIEAGGVEKFNRTVAPTLTSDLLRYRGIEATLKLAESTNAKVVVVGGAGTQGLPLILDTGGAAAPAPAPDPAPVPVPVPVPIPVPVPAAAPGPLPGLPLPGLTPGR